MRVHKHAIIVILKVMINDDKAVIVDTPIPLSNFLTSAAY